ncbi:hypothetical protein [Gloeobacter morelensis]|uniref:DUF4276 family protein n=1 Tax=Gloeobacter morelensis MG652769 TaxID=2781736 RepID=A0ABY3PL13_9CYAN|nr:hypothetical protein [Gloeobacter morelensis]UFP94355.1 hypothetical protein ISF26_21850 [Gloeobacter morelensis MG652769]
MQELKYTLLSDGSSDRALIPILSWLLRQHLGDISIQEQWADLSRLRNRPRNLAEKINTSIYLYPCDVLFVHRDAEREPWQKRLEEINQAVANCNKLYTSVVRVIPVRMQEAWLLFDIVALRNAAGNPSGNEPLELPRLSQVEYLADPKQTLHDLLRCACGLQGRRRNRFIPEQAAVRVTEFAEDFSALRALSAFQALEEEIKQFIATGMPSHSTAT